MADTLAMTAETYRNLADKSNDLEPQRRTFADRPEEDRGSDQELPF
jgi:hypothetical protein